MPRMAVLRSREGCANILTAVIRALKSVPRSLEVVRKAFDACIQNLQAP